MTPLPILVVVLPGEAYLFGKSVVWAVFWSIAYLYWRRDVRKFIAAIIKLSERLVELHLGAAVIIKTTELLPPVSASPLNLKEVNNEKEVTVELLEGARRDS